MKKWTEQWKQKFKDYWKRMYHYTGKKLTRGSQDINKLRTSAHKDEWRRKEK